MNKQALPVTIIQLPEQEEVISSNDLYTAGIFQGESHYEREKNHGFTRFLQNWQ